MRHRATVCLALKSYLSSSEDFHFPFLHLTFIYRGKSDENVFCRDISPYIRFAPLTQRSETRCHRRLGLGASRLAQQHIHGRSLGNGGILNKDLNIVAFLSQFKELHKRVAELHTAYVSFEYVRKATESN